MEILQASDNGDTKSSQETLMLFGGVALMIVGAGMVLSSPAIRKYIGNLNVTSLLGAALPDVERYMKLKSM